MKDETIMMKYLTKSILLMIGLVAITSCQTSEPQWGKLGYTIPIVDLDGDTENQFIVDQQNHQYLGHPSTYLKKDGKTVICVYPKGHGAGAIQMKTSSDMGKTWSPRLPTPKSWETSREVPTLYPTVDSAGKERVLMISGMGQFNRMAISEDDGTTWSELQDIPTQRGGIVAYGDMIELKTGKGHYMGAYHRPCGGKDSAGGFGSLEQFVTFTTDGGVTWSEPMTALKGTRKMHPCEGGFVRSPDGKEILILMRENSRHINSVMIKSTDEGKTWSAPVQLPGALTGDRHQALYLPDGRLFIQFRDLTPNKDAGCKTSPTEGDWVGWVGTYDDLINGQEGQYRIRLKDNCNGWDTAYPCAELFEDGTIMCTTYGHFTPGKTAYVMGTRFKIEDLDARYKVIKKEGQKSIKNNMGGEREFLFDPNDPESINKQINKDKKK